MKFIAFFVMNRLKSVVLTAILSAFCLGAAAQTPTNVEVTGAVQQASVNRFGVNLGDQSYWDSGQMMKNLIYRNPGFEGMMYRSILVCGKATATTCTDDNEYTEQGTGFWSSASYRVLSGKSAGMSGTVVSSAKNPSSCSGCGQIVTFDQSVNAAVGDYFVVTKYFPGHGDQGWWDNTSGGGTISTELTDLSPETAGKQALVLNASGHGQQAGVTSYFDSYTSHSFIQLNGTFQVTFRAKGVGGNNQLYVNVQRNASGLGPYLSQTVTLSNGWQDYTLTFSASETGSAVGTVGVALEASGAAVELDDVSLEQTNSSASNPTAFRDDVVNALKELNPGTIRMMAAGAALGSDLINQIQVPGGRYREGFNNTATEEDDVAYGIHEFLQLCATVGADPWITIPTATTHAEMTDFIEYLTGDGSDPYSALRIARGQTTPWISVFNKIHLELGNETWNGSFKGESMTYLGYTQWANQVFAFARGTTGYVPSKFDLVLDGWSSDPGYTQLELEYSTQHDSVDIAPYLLYSLNNEPQALQFGAMFAEPEMWELPGGIVNQNLGYAKAAARPTYLNVYETNLSSIVGNPTQAQLDATQQSAGAGIAHTDHMLQMMRAGVKYQNAFSMPQFEFQRGDGKTVHLWGLVVDMGATNRRRPQFLTQALANSVVGGTMLQTVQTGANPTWNQPTSSDSVKLNGAHYIQSFAFSNNGNTSVVLFNLNLTTAMNVTLSGANAPSGSVQMSQITSANLTDNNETSNAVQTVTQTLSGFDPSSPLWLPPFSMTVLTMSGAITQAPSFSLPAGSYTSAQTVSITSGTPGATIYYTTDGSTPTANSTMYTGPVTVTTSETMQAVAIVTATAPSVVTSAAYEIATPVAAVPVFSVAAGTYAGAQTVAIADGTAGAVIYYTTNGSVPTTTSTVYSGPIAVSASETISAMAAAANYTASAVVTASYTINGSAAVPVFSVAGGTYAGAQTVAISDATAGAVIYYTTNGSVPTTTSTVYSGPIAVSASETISAMAAAANYTASAVVTASYTINGSAAVPVFSVAAGSYAGAQTVAISDGTAGAVIYYTTNGSVPTTSSTVYSGPIAVSASETISAMAAAANYTASAVVTASYTINGSAAVPVFSVAAGTYAGLQTVAISDGTAGAVIYYTTNGSVPTTLSTVYSGPIAVSASETISAMAAAANYTASAVVTASYTINGSAAVPVFSVAAGTYAGLQTVAISDGTAGAVIYYTTNGSVPTTLSTVYSGPIAVSASETISAMAAAANYTASAVVTASYTINGSAAVPVFSVAAGTYAGLQTVAISDGTAGAVIYYTTNGSVPTTSSTVYSGPIAVSASETISAMAAAPNYTASAVVTASYTINGSAAVPVFSVAGGTYAGAQTVAISDATAGAVIYYTTNGSVPTTTSTVYSGPIAVSASETISAMAAAANYTASAVVTASYTINGSAAVPVFSVAGGTYFSPQTVVITDATAGAVIYYTTDGSAPTSSSAVYTGPVTVSSSETICATAMAPKYQPAPIATAVYTVTQTTAAPTFVQKPGNYNGPLKVELQDATSGAAIYYTVNGTIPSASSKLYSGPIRVDNSLVVRAIAIGQATSSSAVVTGQYIVAARASTPTFSEKSGNYLDNLTVAITSATNGATIYYTTNGLKPTSSSTVYTQPVNVTRSMLLRAIAVAGNLEPSVIATAAYMIRQPAAAPQFSVTSGDYLQSQTIAIEDETRDATIYFTTDGTTPTAASPLYSGPIEVSKNTVLKAVAMASNFEPSEVSRATYSIGPKVGLPSFSVTPGDYVLTQTLKLADATAGATIYYTVDGSTPNASSTEYRGPILIAKSTVVKAMAMAADEQASDVAVAKYTIGEVAYMPSFSVKPGSYSTAQVVTLTDKSGSATIYYTVNGSTPSTSSLVYSQPLTVNVSTEVKAIAVAPGLKPSQVAAAAYQLP